MIRTSVLAALLSLSLGIGPSLAADAAATKPAAKAQTNALPAKPSMDERGRFHAVHKAQDLQCNDCHSTQDVDPLFLRAAESQGSKGPVDRAGCMDCHKSPKKPSWYVGAKK